METVSYEGRMVPASFLGNGVYALFDGEEIWIYTNSHEFPMDKISIDAVTLAKLNAFAKETSK